ncbi:MAG: hypothetical protein OMM_06395 [Candidatus Magnetoglobus multicellularis str. Araruama]|uniref:Uncharacterized protein n=1 Tax=Candidatus Magnetoglobus multicellularis str. Araruama TaxID=890399 RepID=A0A1V1PHG6_9BACT|nr:MAG: hypothetical protein OMM_06395 [Candidatus Magnetoglobus multicellularis str. Araruama]
MDKIFIKLKTARSLGFINILKVLVFRIQCKTRYFEKRLPLKQLTMNHLFYLPDHMHCPDISDQTYRQIKQKTNQIINGNLIFFLIHTKKWAHHPIGF